MLLRKGYSGVKSDRGNPSPLVNLRASEMFLVTSPLGQFLEIDSLTWKRVWSTFSNSFNSFNLSGSDSGELQQMHLLLLLGCIV